MKYQRRWNRLFGIVYLDVLRRLPQDVGDPKLPRDELILNRTLSSPPQNHIKPLALPQPADTEWVNSGTLYCRLLQ